MNIKKYTRIKKANVKCWLSRSGFMVAALLFIILILVPDVRAVNGYNWSNSSTASKGSGGQYFSSIAMSSDGSVLAAVSMGINTSSGAIWISNNSGSTWTNATNSLGLSPSATSWVSVSMSSNGTVIAAVAASGDIWISSNSGVTWNDISKTSSQNTANKDWSSIAISPDGTKLVAVEHSLGGDIWTSNNGGTTWTDQSTSSSGAFATHGNNWQSVAISSDGTHMVASEDSSVTHAIGNYTGNIWISSDSGATWSDETNMTAQNWASVAMSSDGSKIGAVVRGGDIWWSNDGGSTWTDQSINNSGATSKNWSSLSMTPDGSHALATVNGGDLWTSNNGGTTWTDLGAINAGVYPGSIAWSSSAMSSDGTKMSVVSQGQNIGAGDVWYSGDSASTWQDVSLTNPELFSGKTWTSIAMSPSGTTLYALESDNGTNLWQSTDSGTTWTEVSTINIASGSSLVMSSDSTKLAFIGKASSGATSVFTSTNSGATWSSIASPNGSFWYSLAMSSNGTNLVSVDFDGDIWTSNDGGQTWQNHNVNSAIMWTAVAMSGDGSHIAAAGEMILNGKPGYIYTSNDGGSTWTVQNSAGMGNWMSLAMTPDGNHIVANDIQGDVVLSNDGGITWNKILSTQQTTNEQNGSTVSISNDGNTILAGSKWQSATGGYLYISTDNGDTWTNQNSLNSQFGVNGWIQTVVSSDGTKVAGLMLNSYINTNLASIMVASYGTINSNSSGGGQSSPGVGSGGSGNGQSGSSTTSNSSGGGQGVSAGSPYKVNLPAVTTSYGSSGNIGLTSGQNTNITSSSSISQTSLPKTDSGYSYPLGLVNFAMTVPANSSQSITLNFPTTLSPNQVIARKYNPNTQTYTDLPDSSNPSITETSVNGSPALRLTYTIQDNGPLDQDSTVGSVKDPVGLAVVSSQGGLGAGINSTPPNTPNTGYAISEARPLILLAATTLMTLSLAGIAKFSE